jgi:predicted Rossmann fold flavoprotein
MQSFDAVIIGAGAAGMHCAAMAGQRGVKVLLIDHAERVAEKIRISGGGRCNFTNLDTRPDRFLSANPDFCRSALARYTPQDFIALLQRHRIAFHEKHKGQLFCDESSTDIVSMLLRECDCGEVTRWQPCTVVEVSHSASGFELATDRGAVHSHRLVIATGGLSIPKIGATDFGYRLARKFGHKVVETRPGLVPLTFAAEDWQSRSELAGVSIEVTIATARRSGNANAEFTEDLLFTHRGLSGPGVLQSSSYWRPGERLSVNLAPGRDVEGDLQRAKSTSRRKLSNELAEWLPRRLAEHWLAQHPSIADRPMPEMRDRDLSYLASSLVDWQIAPNGTEGYRKAEVTVGGVDTRELSSTACESRKVAGLHFIGEVVDVTGWLGGYNFQWAWASAAACADALARSVAPSA